MVRPIIRTAQSSAADPIQAVREFRAQVWQPEMELVVFFCSSQYDLAALAAEMNRQFAGTRVVGCTTAGEIGPSGYLEHSLSGLSFPAASCTAVPGFFGDLHDLDADRSRTLIRSLRDELETRNEAHADNSFAFLLIDGLSIREEPVTRVFQLALGQIPLIGGSAGDDLKFERTWIFHQGAFHKDAAVLVLLGSVYPFRIFKTQHFTSTAERSVITKADAAQRLVQEINGLPAAQEYARLIGVPVSDLNPACFAASPIVVLIDGADYVRSIQKVNPDNSLSFYCAIDEGLLFRVAHGENLMSDLEGTFASVRSAIGPPQAVLACDCILRNLEIDQRGLKQAAADIFRDNNAVGFSTYGEQYCGMHVNQTLTGIAIGSDPATGVQKNAAAGSAGQPAPNLEIPGAAPEIAAPVLSAGHGLSAEAEIQRLNKIISALVNRAEAPLGARASEFSLFQTAIQLGNQVHTRTRELEAAQRENERINHALQRANHELEAFSYSVAHDLRAPLRAIDGFSAILLLNHAEQLDADGRQHLKRVRESAQRMGLLIDDLLHLSRCSRADLHREPVSLAALARKVMAGLRQGQPERQVEFVVSDAPPALGDSSLLVVLLENLLGNAWKYTRRRADARIEFGYDSGLAAYYVRDNGAGFDMAYAGKLFQVFQRLHSVSEFEGTGIGLAIVQRIVERHGGRVWAEGKVDAGATVHFVLPLAAGEEGAAPAA